jgi:hypothetical protein
LKLESISLYISSWTYSYVMAGSDDGDDGNDESSDGDDGNSDNK